MDDTHPNGMDAKILYCMETSQMPGQQSDYLIVVMKPVKAGGGKGLTVVIRQILFTFCPSIAVARKRLLTRR